MNLRAECLFAAAAAAVSAARDRRLTEVKTGIKTSALCASEETAGRSVSSGQRAVLCRACSSTATSLALREGPN